MAPTIPSRLIYLILITLFEDDSIILSRERSHTSSSSSSTLCSPPLRATPPAEASFVPRVNYVWFDYLQEKTWQQTTCRRSSDDGAAPGGAWMRSDVLFARVHTHIFSVTQKGSSSLQGCWGPLTKGWRSASAPWLTMPLADGGPIVRLKSIK